MFDQRIMIRIKKKKNKNKKKKNDKNKKSKLIVDIYKQLINYTTE